MTSHIARLLGLAPLLLLFGAAPAWAEGTLTHMSGPISVQTPDGKTLPAAVGTKVSAGDIVVTGSGGFVRLEMSDGGEMVLRPDSRLQVDSYKFVKAKPAEDSFVFRMLKGGLRTVTGLIGKRGNKDAYELRTTTATIGIRGTQFDLRVCQANCGALADGTYLAVRFGAVQTSNPQGSLAVAAGQVAFVPPARPPVMLPRDPGIGFTPPPVIPKLDEKKKQQSAPATSQTQGSTTAAAKPAAGAAAAEQKAEQKQEAKQETKQETKPKQEGQGQTQSPSQTQAQVQTETPAPAQTQIQAQAPSALQSSGSGAQNCSVE